MKNIKLYLYILFASLLMVGCSGIKTITIQTQEPAQIKLPETVQKLLVVDNSAPQPKDIGHLKRRLGRSQAEKATVNTDSLSVFYTEALTQFLNEEGFFDVVMLHNQSLRNDNEYWREVAILPDKMLELKEETGADAIISLDKLLISSEWEDLFMQEGYPYSKLTGKISSTLRLYMPSQKGLIPKVQYIDSLYWEGFDLSKDGRAYAEFVVPHAEEALKELAVYAADKMTYVLIPHWITQERWYYTSNASTMREAAALAEQAKWEEAIIKWESFYNNSKKKIDQAKASSNIALGYEMLDDMEKAYEWVLIAEKLFEEATSSRSLERRRVLIYKQELERRLASFKSLDMQQ